MPDQNADAQLEAIFSGSAATSKAVPVPPEDAEGQLNEIFSGRPTAAPPPPEAPPTPVSPEIAAEVGLGQPVPRDKNLLEKAAGVVSAAGKATGEFAKAVPGVVAEFGREVLQVPITAAKQFKPTFVLAPVAGGQNIPVPVPRAAVGIQDELEFMNNVRKTDGWGTAIRAWGYGTRENIGIPMTPEEEQSLAADMDTYLTANPTDPLKLGEELKKVFSGGLSEEEWKRTARGGVNIGALVVGGPVSRVGMGALSRIPGVRELAQNVILKGMVQAEIHSISSFVAWESGLAAIEQEDIGEAAKRGLVLGALTPPAFGLASKILAPPVKATIKGGVKATGATARATDRALSKITTYVRVKKFLEHAWDMGNPLLLGGSAGQTVLRKEGLQVTADRLVDARSVWSMRAGKWVERFNQVMEGLRKDEKIFLGDLLTSRNQGDVLRKIALAGKDPAVFLNRAGRAQELFLEVGTMAEQAQVAQIDAATKQLRTFFKRNDFGMPHRFTNTEHFLKPGPLREEALTILKTAHGKTQRQAEKILDLLHKRSKAELQTGEYLGYSNLMGRKYNLPGFELDPAAVAPDYFADMSRKIEYAIRFGPEGEIPVQGGISAEMLGEGLAGFRGRPKPSGTTTSVTGETVPLFAEKGAGKAIEGVTFSRRNMRAQFPKAFEEVDRIVEPHRRKIVEQIIEDQLGTFRRGDWVAQSLTGVVQKQATIKLGLAQITQLTQFGAALGPSGMRRSLTDFLNTFSRDPELHSRVVQTGALLNSIVRASREAIAGPGAAQAARNLRRIGFTPLDTAARRFGVLRGFSMAEFAAEDLASLLERRAAIAQRTGRFGRAERKVIDKRIAKLNSKFEQLSLDGEAIANRGGVLLEDEVLLAGQKLSTDVNFWSDALSLPTFWRSPWGRILKQFQSFVFQQSKFVKDQLVKPAIEDGDYEPLLRHMAVSQIMGEVVADAKKLIGLKPKDRPKGWERILENWGQGSTFGMLLDVVESTNYSDGIWNQAFGPTTGDAVDILMGMGDLGVNKNPRPLLKKTAQLSLPFIPYVGPIITPATVNLLFPPKKEN